jgi:D-threo-aldose 1-dehydrogenase
MTAPGRGPAARSVKADRPRFRFRPPRFGLGGSSIGELWGPDADPQAVAAVDAAYGAGIRFFDTAPHYGAGRSEQRLGMALAKYSRAQYLLSTMVGRTGELQVDFSPAGIRRSLAESLERLALESVDLVFIRDSGEHWQQAIDEAYPALHELREQGVIGAVGVAMDDWQSLDRFVRDTEVDAVLVAGQYSLLDQSGVPLLDRCQARGVAAIASGVLIGQVLQTDETEEATDEVTIRARRIAAICEQYGVSLPQAALAFPARHPAVTSVLIGAASAAEIRAHAALVRKPVPEDLWRDAELHELADVR